MADQNNRERRDQAVAVGLLRLARYIGMDPEAALEWAEKGDVGDDDPALAAARRDCEGADPGGRRHDPQDPGQINADLILTGAWRALLALAVEGLDRNGPSARRGDRTGDGSHHLARADGPSLLTSCDGGLSAAAGASRPPVGAKGLEPLTPSL